jgi:hypothetical protein
MAPFTIDPAEPDLGELARFYSSQVNEPAAAIRERLEWQSRNPSRRPDVPIVMYGRAASGAIGGAMLCIPHRLRVGPQQHTALMSSGFYVDAAIRGAGIQIFLTYRALSARHILYATTANAQTARLWQSAGGRTIAQTDYELLRPIRWPGVLEEMIVQRLGARASLLARAVAPLGHLRALASRRAAGGELLAVDRPEDAVTEETGDGVQPVRDAAFIRWRFFDVPQVDARVYRFRHEASGADGFVALTHARRGYRRQLRTVYLADSWGRMPSRAFPALLDAIGARCRSTADLLSMRCVRQDKEREALAAGSVRRNFDCPIGWFVDSQNLLGAAPVLFPAAATELV